MTLIATLPPYVRHREAIARHPSVDELRFNTIMPIAGPKRDVLVGLLEVCAGKRLHVDLKARQLRITRFAYLPYAFVEISRRIHVNLPARVLFKDGEAEIVRIVEGNKLILAERPPRVVGAGEPITILSESLVIEGYLTEDDREYIAAARSLGIHDYMLSFVEQASDLDELRALDPEARITAKIESQRGVMWVGGHYDDLPRPRPRLMAARDDLLLQMGPARHEVLDALELIVMADRDAIVASRLLESLEGGGAVSLGDLSDVALMHMLGYRTFLLGDGVCFSEQAFGRAVAAYDGVQTWLEERRE